MVFTKKYKYSPQSVNKFQKDTTYNMSQDCSICSWLMIYRSDGEGSFTQTWLEIHGCTFYINFVIYQF